MDAKSIGALVAILVVVIFAGYIIAGGITGFFITVPATDGVTATETENIVSNLPEESKTPGEPVTEFMPEESPAELKKPDLCEGVTCPSNNATCPDQIVISCQPECNPLTGQCLSCTPNCSEHQATGGGGGGGGSPSPPPCTDTSWTIQGEWSECSPEGKQTAAFKSNCGNTETETQNCTPSSTTVWVSPETIADTTTVDVKINTTDEVYAVNLMLYFNSSILNATKVLEGDFLNNDSASTFVGTNETNESGGYVWFASTRFNTLTGVSGEGTLATITFTAIDTGTSTLDLEDIEISNSELEAIENIIIHDGTIEVV